MPVSPGGPRCTRIKLNGERCKLPPIKGATVCGSHGGRAPQVRSAAACRVAEDKARAEIAKQGVVVEPDQNPLDVLEDAMHDIVRLKTRLGAVVDRLADESLRYPGRAGEQLRGELQAYQSALRDTVKAAETMIRLDISERRIQLDTAMARMIVTVLRRAVEAAGLGDEQRQALDLALAAELRRDPAATPAQPDKAIVQGRPRAR